MNKKTFSLFVRRCSVRAIVLLAMAVTAMLASCSSENDVSDGNRLPEGQYPVTFTATGLEISAATRATSDDTWDGDETVAVQVDGVVKNYSADGSGANTTLKAAEGVTPFYWKSADETKYISAWYCGDGSTAADKKNATAVPQTWSVQSDQRNQSNGYQESDFLYAPQIGIDFQGTKSLIFYHQTAKVVVNIRKGVANDADKVTVTINAVKDGVFTTPLTNNCGLSAKTGVNPSGINSFRLGTPNTNVIFKDEGNAEDALASFQALVIPQTLGSNTPIEIKIDGYDTFKYTPTETLAGGTQYTYNLTIDGKEVKATVTSTPNWEDEGGSNGTGSITSPIKINLSDGKDVNIKREDVSYLISGTGSKTIDISCNATVILNEVTMDVNANSCINITGGSSKLIFCGKNTLKSLEGVIFLSNNATVTIEGDGAQNSELKISGKNGIGAYCSNCSDISISDIALNINCAYGGVGVCVNSVSNATCGNISLTNCLLNISTEDNSACIGASTNDNFFNKSKSKCGKIELRNCEIFQLATKKTNYNRAFLAAAIGCSGGYAVCGDINVYLRDGESVDDFLKNITVPGDVDKVGKGNEDESLKPSIGTVTWYDHAEKKVGEGQKK